VQVHGVEEGVQGLFHKARVGSCAVEKQVYALPAAGTAQHSRKM
jgi:hypothetical protein